MRLAAQITYSARHPWSLAWTLTRHRTADPVLIDVLPGLKARGFLPCRSCGTSEGSCFTDNRLRMQGSYAVSAGV